MDRDRLTFAGNIATNGIPVWYGPIPQSKRFSVYLERDGAMEFFGIASCRPALDRLLHGFGIDPAAHVPDPA